MAYGQTGARLELRSDNECSAARRDPDIYMQGREEERGRRRRVRDERRRRVGGEGEKEEGGRGKEERMCFEYSGADS